MKYYQDERQSSDSGRDSDWQSPRTHSGVSQQVSINSSRRSPFPLAEF